MPVTTKCNRQKWHDYIEQIGQPGSARKVKEYKRLLNRTANKRWIELGTGNMPVGKEIKE